MEKGCLDLGAGNIFKTESHNKRFFFSLLNSIFNILKLENRTGDKKGTLPEIDVYPQAARNKRQILVDLKIL